MTPVAMKRFLNNPDEVASSLKEADANKSFGGLRKMLYPLSCPLPRLLPDHRAEAEIKALAEEMPHFEAYFKIVFHHIALVRRFGSTSFTLPNILLVGAPGIGKTYVMAQVAKCLGVSFAAISMSLYNSKFALAGMERGWSGSQPGALVSVASKLNCINGMLMLDEFEKAKWETGGNMESVVAPVLQLCERDTASSFVDVCVEGDFDFSELSILATANDTAPIPEPIQSRFTTLHIPNPPASALQKMTSNILTKAAREDLGLDWVTVAAEPCVAEVFNGSLSPRTLRNQSASILYPLLSDERRGLVRVTGQHLRDSMIDQQSQANARREIGFY